METLLRSDEKHQYVSVRRMRIIRHILLDKVIGQTPYASHHCARELKAKRHHHRSNTAPCVRTALLESHEIAFRSMHSPAMIRQKGCEAAGVPTRVFSSFSWKKSRSLLLVNNSR